MSTDNIYITGMKFCGLGNHLFQIAVAIYYHQKYPNYNIILKKTPYLLYGTSNMYNRVKMLKDNNNHYIDYSKTIFKNFIFEEDDIITSNYITIHNNFTDNIVDVLKQDILISGYCQHRNLFFPYLHKISDYLHLKDEQIINYVKTKYPNIDNSICIGIRIGDDYSGMKKLTINSYKKALEYYKQNGIDTSTIYIIGDKKDIHLHDFIFDNCVEINEPDVVQLYAGILCKHYILSESTFHLWIAYIATINNVNKNVIYFNNTLITEHNLELSNLKNWIGIDY